VFSRFFIDRPIFASVLSIMVTLAGGVALITLPVAQYPEITPPTIEVSARYPGANAKDVAETVGAPLEQQVNGVEGMLYMSAQSTNDGTYTLTVTFENGTDLNIAQVLVQNRIALAQPVLPALVQRLGVSVKKKSPSVLLIVNLYSPRDAKEKRDALYLSNYATIQLKDELARLPGVGDITYLGQRDYSMRVWLDPDRMTARGLSASDITSAITAQNTQVAAGLIGQPPVGRGQVFQFTMSTMGRLLQPEEFGEIIVKADEYGKIVRLREVANIEMGAQAYDQTCTLDEQHSVALSVYQLPGSNALSTATGVRAKMADLRQRFPEGVDYEIVYDTTPFINESINEVFKTLRDAVILVAIVVLLFLQNWRSAIIPLAAVPVAIIGTFAAMAAVGFSLNMLTLFGLVLAIGIVVDDAIVVVEAVEHHIEQGMQPRDATILAMKQVSGPVIAVGLVLSAVFIPCAFISGITGQFYRQFAVTIAVSTLISTFNSLTLSPALSALLLRPRSKTDTTPPLPRVTFLLAGAALAWVLAERLLVPQLSSAVPGWSVCAVAAAVGALLGWLIGAPLNLILGGLFRGFNVGFDRATGWYTRGVGLCLRTAIIVLLVYGGLLYLTWLAMNSAPKGFIPMQDKGYLLVNVQLPDSTSLQRTQTTVQAIENEVRKMKGVKHTVAVAGQSLLLGANAPNFGSMYVMLDDFEHRRGHDLGAYHLGEVLRERLQEKIPDGLINVFGAPPLDGLGNSGGIKIIVEDRGEMGLSDLQDVGDKIVASGQDVPELSGLFTPFRARTPWIYLEIDRAKARAQGVLTSDLFSTLQIYLGSLYVNDFNRFGRTWQVIAQADGNVRQKIEGIKALKVRNATGGMVSLGGLIEPKAADGPVMIVRYNLYQAVPINATPRPGVGSTEAIQKFQELARSQQGWSMQTEWTELALLQLRTGNTATWVFVLAVVLVFLVLAAQYESWTLPLAVILVVPMCLLCSVSGVMLAGMDVNIFTQVGFVVLIGLACKNAILIVEFARAQREAGQGIREATLAACQLRLRPIVMTSLAFILGVVPLVLAEGAGGEMRRLLGTAVFYGMLGVTLFGIFLTPVFFFAIQWVTERFTSAEDKEAEDQRKHDQEDVAEELRKSSVEMAALPSANGYHSQATDKVPHH
jgi:multidrug efflux pump subunit AcrB